jgi:hypothetical protein
MIALFAPSYRGSPNQLALYKTAHPPTQDMTVRPFVSPRRRTQPRSAQPRSAEPRSAEPQSAQARSVRSQSVQPQPATSTGGMLLGVDGKEWSMAQRRSVVADAPVAGGLRGRH